jgi:glycosyltransferase involved in cell wall biosynthesis
MKVLQLIDSLETGGAERMAVTYANELANHLDRSFLCATRKEGLLKATIDSRVDYLFLKKSATFDLQAILRLYKYVAKNKIDVIHAHSSSFFYATILKFFKPSLKLIWHDHYGQNQMLQNRKFGILKGCSRFFNVIISVNENLKEWAVKNLKCDSVFYLKNFISESTTIKPSISLQGEEGFRIVCLANIREQKDHLNLLNAFKLAQKKHSFLSLHLLGKINHDSYYNTLLTFIKENKLEQVFFYDAQNGVLELLKSCDIGVLSSKSEGLPVALLEYGFANLPVVCTDVGQCKEVINDFGFVISPGNSENLALALLTYIENPTKRKEDALAFSNHIRSKYTFQAVQSKILSLYKLESY